jgi:hypothetical protein
VIEEDLPRLHLRDAAVDELETARLVHPGVDRNDRHRAADPADSDRHTCPEVLPAAEATPAIEVNSGEDGFQEEEHSLETERHPQHRAVLAHQARPQQAHLEGQHSPGHCADRNQYAQGL